MARGTPGRTGFASGSLPEADLSLQWRATIDLPDTDRGSLSASAPVVGEGLVVVADSRRVHAYSVSTGELEWRSDPVAPTFYDSLYEYEANTAAPAIGPDGTVVVPSEDGLFGLAPADGAVEWAVTDLRNVGPPAIADGTVLAQGRETVLALDVGGSERWRRSVSRGEEPTPPALGPEAVVARTESGLRGFDPATGEERWSSDQRTESGPVLDGGVCLVGNTGGLHALDARSGAERWSFSRGDYRALLSPVVAPDTIYAVEQPGEAGAASFALDRTDGEPEPRWCSYIGSGSVAAATAEMALGILSIGEGPDAAQGIVGFSAPLGDSLWAIEGGSRPRDWVTPPAILDGVVIATTRGGTVAAISGAGADA
jgi:outer membrane protein assembly factor BamB